METQLTSSYDGFLQNLSSINNMVGKIKEMSKDKDKSFSNHFVLLDYQICLLQYYQRMHEFRQLVAENVRTLVYDFECDELIDA